MANIEDPGRDRKAGKWRAGREGHGPLALGNQTVGCLCPSARRWLGV